MCDNTLTKNTLLKSRLLANIKKGSTTIICEYKKRLCSRLTALWRYCIIMIIIIIIIIIVNTTKRRSLGDKSPRRGPTENPPARVLYYFRLVNVTLSNVAVVTSASFFLCSTMSSSYAASRVSLSCSQTTHPPWLQTQPTHTHVAWLSTNANADGNKAKAKTNMREVNANVVNFSALILSLLLG